MPRRKRQSMIKLLRNKCNGCASSSPQKLKFSGTPVSIGIIDTYDSAGERCYLAETDKQGFMDLSLRFDIDSAKEEYQSPEGEECRDDYLRIKIFHLVPFSSAKVLQKSEPTKKVSSRAFKHKRF